MHHLSVQELLQDGSLIEVDIIGKDAIVLQANPDSLYSIIERLGEDIGDHIEVVREGLDLLVKIDGQLVLKITSFYQQATNASFNLATLGNDLLLTSSDEMTGDLVWSSAPPSDSTSIAKDSETDALPSISDILDISSVEVGGDVAGMGAGFLALAALGGGGSSSSASVTSSDTTPPVYQSLAVDTVNDTITITYDSALDASNAPATSDFTISQNSVAISVTSVTITGSNVVLQLGSAINTGQSLSIVYTDPSAANDANAIQDTAGNDAADLSKTLAAGVVADGYISGATVFIDVDGDGVYGAGDIAIGTTDANGNFMVPDGISGTVIATGGVNIDTGLPNTLALKAPEGATVINPLTTLVQEYSETYNTSAANASTQVAQALGLTGDLGSNDLLTYDPIDSGNTAVQKVAAQIATVLTLVEDSAGSAAVDGVATNLVTELKSNYDANTTSNVLTDTTKLSSVIGDNVDSNNLTSVTNAVKTANDSIDSAADLDAITQAQSNSLDDIDPAKATALDLHDDSDSGADDLITNNPTPAISFTIENASLDGTALVAGDKVELRDTSQTVLATYTLTSDDISNGKSSISPTNALAEGSHDLHLVLKDKAGNESAASDVISVVVDVTAPSTNLTIVSLSADTGTSSSDFNTNTAAQTVTATLDAALNSDETLHASVDGGSTWVDVSSMVSNTTLTWTGIELATGTSSLQLKRVDTAGNESTPATQAYTLDTTAPTNSVNAISIDADNGQSGSDLVTNTGSFTVSATLATSIDSGDIVQLSTDSGSSWPNTMSVDGTTASLAVTDLVGSGSLQVRLLDEVGNSSAVAAESFTIDSQAPAQVSTFVDAANKTITINYDEALDSVNLAAADRFTITMDVGGANTANAVASVGVNGSTVALVLTESLIAGDLQVVYTDATAGDDTSAVIQDTAGNDAANYDSGAIASGVVIDGYISGSHIFLDTDGDLTYNQATDTSLGYSDSAGNYFLADTSLSGNFVATGGTNIDTGLPNNITLIAPQGASVINPFTTMMSHYVSDQGGTVSDAAILVRDALGLDNTLDLLTYDPLAANNATGIATQKVAAQLATIMTMVHDYPADGLDGDTAQANVIDAMVAQLASADASNTSINLNSLSLISSLAGDYTSLPNQVAAAMSSLDSASTYAGISAAQSNVMDETAPAAPLQVDLHADSDTGFDTSDNITADATPTFVISLEAIATDGTAAVAGDTLYLYAGSSEVASYVLTSTDIGNTSATLTSSALTVGEHQISAKLIDVAGNVSASSTALTMTVATQAPTLTITDNQAAESDGGAVVFTLTFDAPMYGMAASLFSVSGGSIDTNSLTGNDGDTVFTLSATPDTGQESGTLVLSIDGSNATVQSNLLNYAGVSLAPAVVSQSQAYDSAGPTVTSVTAPASGSFVLGDNISFVVAFNENIDISGVTTAPSLNIAIGSDSRTVTNPVADDSSLTFTYTVTNADGANGQTLSINSLAGEINDTYGNTATAPSLNNVSNTTSINVDGTASGQGADGYLSGVTIFADNDNSGDLSAGDSVAIANATGGFSIYGASGAMVMYGGEDISTGLSFNVQYEAPSGYTVINPVSTLIRAVQKQTDNSNDAAWQTVQAAMYVATSDGPSTTEIAAYDPFDVASNTSDVSVADAAVEYQKVAAAVATVVEVVSQCMAGLGTASSQQAGSVAMFDYLASNLPTDGSLLASLQEAAYLQGMVEEAFTDTAGVNSASAEQKAAAVTILQAAMSQIADAGGSSAISQLTEVAKVQMVAQGDAGDELEAWMDGTAESIEMTPESMGTMAQDASVGVIVPVSYVIQSHSANDSLLEGQNGELIEHRFIITRGGNTSIASSIDYAVSGGEGLLPDMFDMGSIPTGSISFAAGEESRTLSIYTKGNDVEQANEVFMVSLVDDTGMAQIDGADGFAYSVIVDDDPFIPTITMATDAEVASGATNQIPASVNYYDSEADLSVSVSGQNTSLTDTSFSGNLAAVNDFLADLLITPTVGEGSGSLSISVSADGGSKQASHSTNLNVHNAPTSSVSGTIDVVAGKVATAAVFSLGDVDGNHLTALVQADTGSLSVLDDVLASSGASINYLADGVALMGSANQINSALQGLQYAGEPGVSSADISLIVNDGDELTANSQSTVVANVSAAPPELTLPSMANAVTPAKESAIQGLSVADSDSNLLALTLDATQGTLSAAAQGLAVVTGGGSASLTIEGSAADINTTIAAVRFTAAADASTPGLQASLTDNDSNTLDVVDQAIPLVVIANGPPEAGGDIDYSSAINEDAGTTSISISGINLTDSDGTTTSEIRILSVTGASLPSDLLLGAAGSIIDASGGNVNLSITPDENHDQDIVITYAVVDGEISTLNSLPSSIIIPVTAINDAPVVQPMSATGNFVENGDAYNLAANLSLTDIDSSQIAGATITISSPQSGDLIMAGNLPTGVSIDTTNDGSNGILALSGEASLSDYEALLRKLSYLNSSDDPVSTDRQISLAITDQEGGITTVTRTVTITPINDAPVVNSSAQALTYTEGSDVVLNGITLSDADSDTLSSATVTIESGYRANQDSLVVNGSLPTAITAAFDNGTLSLSGAASIADYQTALSLVAYSNSHDQPSTVPRILAITVTDDSGDVSMADLQTIAITPIADAPEADLNGDSVAGNNATATFTQVLYPNGVSIAQQASLSDIDSQLISAMTISLSAEGSNDGLALTTGAQAVALVTGISIDDSQANQLVLTGDAAVALYQSVLQGLLFTHSYTGTDPDPDIGTNRSVTVTLTDGDDNSVVSASRTITVTHNASPLAAVTSGTLILTGDPSADVLTIDLSSMLVSAGSGRLSVGGDPLFSANSIDVSALTVATTQITGNDKDNSITGSAQADDINGGGGTDIIAAGAGDDTVYYQAGSTIDGGADTDTLMVREHFDLTTDTNISNFEIIDASQANSGVTLTGAAGITNMRGSSLGDTINLANGQTGQGNGGHDTFVLTDGATITIADISLGDRIFADSEPVETSNLGEYTFGNDGNLTLTGWDANWSFLLTETDNTYEVVMIPQQIPSIDAMSKDSGVADDWITNDGTAGRVITGSLDAKLEAGELVQVLTDGTGDWDNAVAATTVGTNWSAIDQLTHYGDFTIEVRIYNSLSGVAGQAGNANTSVSQSVTLDTTVVTPGLSLQTDSGLVGDLLTNDASLSTPTNLEANASLQYSSDGSTWVDAIPVAVAGDNSVYVRQIDVAGNVSAAGSLTFRLDQTNPDAPAIGLSQDSGASGDFITNNYAITASGESSATIEYFQGVWGTDDAADDANWAATQPAPSAGNNTLYVRQLDAAGNASNATSLSFFYDATAPVDLVLSLHEDTGVNGDNVTSNNQVDIGTPELGAYWEYSIDGGTSFSRGTGTSFELADGTYAVNSIQVRQVDGAGNQSQLVNNAQAWTIDTQVPTVISTHPADGGNVGKDDNLSFVISKTVTAQAGKTLSLYTSDGTLVESFAVDTDLATSANSNGTTSVVINPAADLDDSLAYYITMDAGAWADEAGNALAAVSGNESWNFEVTAFSISLDPVSTDDVINADDDATSITVGGEIRSNSALLDSITVADLNVVTSAGSLTDVQLAASDNGVRTWSANLDLSAAADQSGIAISVSADIADDTPFTISSQRLLDMDTSIDNPSINLALDSGSSDSDGVSHLGTVVISGLEEGADWYYTIDGSDPSDVANGARTQGAGNQITLAEGSYAADAIKVWQTDAAGNQSAVVSNTSTWQIDQSVGTPVLTMPTDSDGTNDGRTSSSEVSVSGLTIGDTLHTSMDGGASWQSQVLTASTYAFDLDDGDYAKGDVLVQLEDVAGNTSAKVFSTSVISIDSLAPAQPSIETVADDDLINIADATANIVVSGSAEPGSAIEVSWVGVVKTTSVADDANSWSVTYASNELPTSSASIEVTATDATGNQSVVASHAVEVDITAPDAPTVSGFIPTGQTAYASETNVDSGVIEGSAEADSKVEIFVNGHAAFATVADASGAWQVDYAGWYAGEFSITATATDTAGNTGTVSAAQTLGMDNEAEALGLIWTETGSQGLTNEATINIEPASLEPNATWQYSLDGGTSWQTGTSTSFELSEGSYNDGDIQVKQTDALGNISPVTVLDSAVTLDQSVADPSLALFNDTGVAGSDDSFSDGVTRVAKMTVTGLELGASWQYSEDAGNSWSSARIATASADEFILTYDASTLTTYAADSILVRQTDVAGNASDVVGYASQIQIDYVNPTVTIAVDGDQRGLNDTVRLNNVDGSTATITIDFSEQPLGFSLEDLTFEGGTITDLSVDASDNSLYTATISADADRNIDGRLIVKSGWTDAVGNTGTQAETPVYIDTSNPEFDAMVASWDDGDTIDDAPLPVINLAEQDAGAGASLDISLNSDDGVEDGQSISLQIKDSTGAIVQLGGADTSTVTASENQAQLTISQADMANFSHGETYAVYADTSDATGNNAATYSVYQFTVDNQIPVIVSIVPAWVEDGNLLAAEAAQEQIITVTTTGVEDNQTVYVSLNSVQYTGAVTDNQAVITVPSADLLALADFAQYDITVNVDDAAGNPAETVVTPAFNVDVTIPEITSVTASWGDYLNIAEAAATDGKVTIQTSEDQTHGQQGANVTVTINGQDYVGSTDSNGQLIVEVADLTALTDGDYAITVNMQDLAGNSAIAHQATNFTTDLIKPSISWGEASGLTELTAGQTAQLVLQLNEAPADDFDPQAQLIAHHGELANYVLNEQTLELTVDFTPDAMKTFNGRVEILADQFNDLADNLNTASSSITFGGNTWQATTTSTNMGDLVDNLTSLGDVVDLGLGDDEINISAGDDFIDGDDGFDVLVLPTGTASAVTDNDEANTLIFCDYLVERMPDGEVVVTNSSDMSVDTTLYNMEAISIDDKVFNLLINQWQPIDSEERIDGTPWGNDAVSIDLDQLLGLDVSGTLSMDANQRITSDSDSNVALTLSKLHNNGQEELHLSNAAGELLLTITAVESVTLTTDSSSSDELAINPTTDLV